MTIHIETLRTARDGLRTATKAALCASVIAPVVLMAGAGVGLVPIVTAADVMIPISGAIMALAVVLGFITQGVAKLIQRAEVQEVMDFYGLTPGCLALTPEELAEGDDQKTPVAATGKG